MRTIRPLQEVGQRDAVPRATYNKEPLCLNKPFVVNLYKTGLLLPFSPNSCTMATVSSSAIAQLLQLYSATSFPNVMADYRAAKAKHDRQPVQVMSYSPFAFHELLSHLASLYALDCHQVLGGQMDYGVRILLKEKIAVNLSELELAKPM